MRACVVLNVAMAGVTKNPGPKAFVLVTVMPLPHLSLTAPLPAGDLEVLRALSIASKVRRDKPYFQNMLTWCQ